MVDNQRRRNIAGGDDPRRAGAKLPSVESVVFEFQDHEAAHQSEKAQIAVAKRQAQGEPLRALIKQARASHARLSQEKLAELIPAMVDALPAPRPYCAGHRQLVKKIAEMEKSEARR
jgi:hypothetical protein